MKFAYKPGLLLLLTVIALAFASVFTANAEPYLAYQNQLKCQACHVNPNGGGMRNDFGRAFGQNVLAQTPTDLNANDWAKISEYLSVGANARFNANFSQDENDNRQQSFDVESAAVYLHLKLPISGLSFYIDEQIAPGAALNREAWAMMTFDSGHQLKVGKMFLPYGLRIEDDSAFIRQVTGMNFDNSDTGVEYSLNYTNTSFNFFVSNGTSQASNDDDEFLYGARAEHLFSRARIGATAVINAGENTTQMLNLYAGYNWQAFTILAEADFIKLENANPQTGGDVEQSISLVELNYQWRKGLNIKLTTEFFDPDLDIDENQQTRHSLVTEYTPFSNIQLRFGLRLRDDIPQKPTQNNEMIFLQSHFYF